MITSKNLSFKYPQTDNAPPPLVLDNISLQIEAGDFVAILGANGSGKSTLARHFNALLSPTEGTLWIRGLDTADPQNTWQIRQSTGMVFQNPDNQIISAVVEEDVAFGPENLGIPPEEIRRRVTESLSQVGMSKYALHEPHRLSGGQKQRIAIAGVLAMRPCCIVLDEPSAMLDPKGRKEVLDTIIKLNREANITVILITHFMEEAAKANRVIIMNTGNVVMDGTPKEIFSRPAEIKKLGLDVPQSTALAQRLKENGINLPDGIINTDEFIHHIKPLLPPNAPHPTPPAPPQTQPPSQPIIELKNVSHIYSPNSVFEKIALNNISLTIMKGECIAIIGHTGSGKSTLIQHFNALLTPTEGTVLINNEEIPKDKTSIRQKIGLIFQYPEHQLFEVTVFKDVSFGPQKMGLPEEEINERAKQALTAVGITEDFYEKSPFELSGGQKRRVAIAGVLAMRPEVLILDEPAAGLDPRGREELFSHLKKMHKELQITIILISHSMDDAARLSNRIFVMNDGEIAFSGTPKEIFSRSEELTAIGLDVPQVSHIMAQLNAIDTSTNKSIFTTRDAATEILSKIRGEK